MPSATDAVLAAVRAAEGTDGRLPAPSSDALGDIFPFEPPLRVVAVSDPVVPEPPRHGEGGVDCHTCTDDDSEYLWTSTDWRLRAVRSVPQLPGVVMLEPRRHLDLGDLDEPAAAELGRLTVRVERAVAAGPGVGRVHVYRIGDGGAHLHVWFIPRPEGLLQLRGSSLAVWLDVLPELPAAVLDGAWAAVAGRMTAGSLDHGSQR